MAENIPKPKSPESYAQLYNETAFKRKGEVLALILKWHYDKAFTQIRSRRLSKPEDIIGVLDGVNKKFKLFAKKTKSPYNVTLNGFEIMVFKKDPDFYKLWFDTTGKKKK